MNYTDAEIALCKKLCELGVRSEIRVGDRVILPVPLEEIQFVKYAIEEDDEIVPLDFVEYFKKSDCILVWTWEKCRKWLKERGWKLTGHVDYPKEIMASFSNMLRDKLGRGQTDCECALAVMVQVAEEKHESD